MAGLGFSGSAVNNNKSAGISSVNFAVDTYVDTLSQIYDGIFKQVPYSRKKQIGAERAHGFLATAEWKYMLANKVNIALLSTLNTTGGSMEVNLNFINGDNAVLGDTTVGDVGAIKWKLVIEGNADKDRYIQMMVQRAGVYTGNLASNFDNDSLFGSYTPGVAAALFTGTSVQSSGASAFAIRATDTYESLGRLQDVKLTAELICDEDAEKRYVPRNIHIEYDISVMDVTSTSLAVLDSYHDLTSVDQKFTFMDGTIFSPVDQLGGLIDVIVDGDSDKNAIIKCHGSGDILQSAWAALWSVAA
jgi:hypothetical protein